jgi:putative radical SAM enzyme (TIGR03279 family)
LSFTYGSYITLTNLGPRGFQRLMDQKLSPLYVSVHATEPEVRTRLLGVPRGGDIVEKLETLTAAGTEVHTQVVLCPGWNDAEHLDRTLADLWALGPNVLSVSIVPVGLTKYNLERPVRLLKPAETRRAIRQVQAARQRAVADRGIGWAYAADELFLTAGLPVPPADYYDEWPLTENGVGAVRRFLDDIGGIVADPPRLDGLTIGIVTGDRMGRVMAPLVERLGSASGAAFRVIAVENRLFGPTVTTAGLLPGEDIRAALEDVRGLDAVLLPAEALNDDGLFIDSLPFSDLAAATALPLLPAYELSGALSQL